MRTGQNIYKRKDGRWEARVFLGKKSNGRPHFKYLYASTYRKVLFLKNNYEKMLTLSNETTISTALFSDSAYKWLADSSRRWKPATYIKYKNFLEKYILPEWNTLYVREIHQDTYDKLVEHLAQSLSGSSLHTINTIINGSLKHTKNSLPILCKNPISNQEKHPLDVLSDSESYDFLLYLKSKDSLTTVGIQLALFSGIRLGELCALTWEDIDLKEQVLHIRHTLQRIQNREQYFGEPKTVLYLGSPKNKRERTIPLHPQMIPILEKLEKSCYPSDYLLSGNSSPIEPRTMTSRFKKVLKSCGIRDFHFHTLRHTFATRCVESGMQIKALSEMLGHSSVKITMDRYVHLSMSFKQSQITILRFPDSEIINRQETSQNYPKRQENMVETGVTSWIERI